jgi:hypothetical protein
VGSRLRGPEIGLPGQILGWKSSFRAGNRASEFDFGRKSGFRAGTRASGLDFHRKSRFRVRFRSVLPGTPLRMEQNPVPNCPGFRPGNFGTRCWSVRSGLPATTGPGPGEGQRPGMRIRIPLSVSGSQVIFESERPRENGKPCQRWGAKPPTFWQGFPGSRGRPGSTN